jgi:hypothetical protein
LELLDGADCKQGKLTAWYVLRSFEVCLEAQRNTNGTTSAS